MKIKIAPQPADRIPESLYDACRKNLGKKLDAYPGKRLGGQAVVFLVSAYNHAYCLDATDGYISNCGNVSQDTPNSIDGTPGYCITGPAFKTLTIS